MENLQEATVSISEQHKKIGHKLGDLPDNRQEAAPLPEATQSHPLNDLLPSQTQDQSLLHFTISNPNQSRRKAGYHLATKRDLDRVNNYAQGLQEAAQWYRDNLANSTISYVYKDETIKSPLIVQITFEEKQFMHLTGLFPLKDGQTAEKTLQDFAEGNGDFDHLMIANRGAAFQKLQVLPEIKDMLRTDAFYFDYVADIPRLHNIDMETAIKSDEGGFVTAFRSNEEGLYPASLLELTPDLLDEFTQAPPGKTILGIYRDRDGQLEQVAINKEYVKDGGQKLFRILQENKAKEKALDRSQELNSNTGGELFNRNSSFLEGEPSGTAPQPVELKTQPTFSTNVHLHFTTDDGNMSNKAFRRNLRTLNLYANTMRDSAQWYLSEVADTTMRYIYKTPQEEDLQVLSVHFDKKKWIGAKLVRVL